MGDDLDRKLRQIIARELDDLGQFRQERVDEIKALIDQQKQELLDALTIEKQQPKHPYGEDDGVKLLCVGFNNCVDELEARKQKWATPETKE